MSITRVSDNKNIFMLKRKDISKLVHCAFLPKWYRKRRHINDIIISCDRFIFGSKSTAVLETTDILTILYANILPDTHIKDENITKKTQKNNNNNIEKTLQSARTLITMPKG